MLMRELLPSVGETEFVLTDLLKPSIILTIKLNKRAF
jgi:hypothetical protein